MWKFCLSGNKVSAHRVEFLRALKRPGEAVGVIALNQVGVRLFAVAARPQFHHVIIPLVEALRGRKMHHLHTRLLGFIFKMCTHQKKSAGVFFLFSVRLTARKKNLQRAEHTVSKTKVMRDNSPLTLFFATDRGSLWKQMPFHSDSFFFTLYVRVSGNT